MTKVARLFEEEKLTAVAEAIEKEREQAKKQALDTAKELIKEGFKPEKIVKCVKNLTLEDVINLQEKINRKEE